MPDLRDEETWRHAGRLRMGLRGALVVVQVTLSLVLLVGATLLLRSLGVARSFDLGFRPEGLAFVSFDLGMHGYDETKGKAFQDLMLERVRALPGVEAAALSFQVPFDVSQRFIGIFPEGTPREPGANPVNVDAAPVGAGYFETMGVPIVEGRGFTEADTETTPGVAVVSEAFARRFWPGQEAVGKHIELARGGSVEVVGVSREYKLRTIGEAPLPFLHLARAQRYEAGGHLLARTRGDAARLLAALRSELLALNPDLALTQAKTMTEQLAVPLFPVRMGATILGGFGLFALFLASVGLYGVIAYSVSRRTREIAIRMAIGARRQEVVRMVVGEGMALVAVGVLLGLLGAAATTRLLTAVLYSVSPFDPLAFGLATSALVGAALLANAVPARRAASVDPLRALRHE
jgi:predicted permease